MIFESQSRAVCESALPVPCAALILAFFFCGMSDSPGQTIRLNTPGEASRYGVGTYAVTGDSQRVIYRAQFSSLDDRLYSASTSAPNTEIQLSGTQALGNTVRAFGISPDGTKVLFDRFNTSQRVRTILTSSTTASGSEEILAENVANAFLSDIRFTPDGSRAVFIGLPSDNEGPALYSILTGGPSTPLRLTSPFAQIFGGLGNLGIVSTPAGIRAIYTAAPVNRSQIHVYSTPVDSSESEIRLSSAPYPDVRILDEPGTRIAVTPDGTGVIYISNFDYPEYGALYRASTTAGNNQTRISSRAHPTGEVTGFLMKPGSASVYYVGNLVTESAFSIYEASTDGDPNQQVLYSPAVEYQNVKEVVVTPDAANMVFRGRLLGSVDDALFIASTNFTRQPRRISGQDDGQVSSFRVSNNGAFIVFEKYDGAADTLWAVSTTGNFAPVQIAPLPGDNLTLKGAVPFLIRPDDQAVIYTASITGQIRIDLHSIAIPPLNGSPNPDPPGALVGQIGPGGSDFAPTLAVLGKLKIKTTKSAVTVKGTANDDRAVVSVLASYRKTLASGKKRTLIRPARLSGSAWSFKVRPREKVTKVSFGAVDDAGQRSPLVRVKVIRK